jgi:hypothetical protein
MNLIHGYAVLFVAILALVHQQVQGHVTQWPVFGATAVLDFRT